jgi:CheY-like chemotaxis protein
LETAGYEVGEAANGQEALDLLERDRAWDAVILDQKMPGLAGTDVLQRIKVLIPDSRVIMMTAFASVELAVEAMKLGASDLVRKPMTPEIIRNALTAALASEASEPAAAEPHHRPAGQFGTITLNGFRILRAADLRRVLPHQANEECFVVKRPDGKEQEVRVEIADAALQAVEAATAHRPLAKSFWTEQAERFLIDFIWNDGDVPHQGRLILRAIEPEELEQAVRRETGK